MKFKGLLASAMSGSMAGVVASHNRGGQYFRGRTTPVNPSTVFQQAVRGLMAQLSSAWVNTLDDDQRNAWDNYALNTPLPDSLGDARNAGGKGMYIRGNLPRLQAGLTRVDDGPSSYGLPALSEPTVTTMVASTGVLTFGFTNTDDWAVAVGGALLVYVSRPLGPATNFFKGPFQFAGKVSGAMTPPTTPKTVNSPFTYAAGQPGRVRFVSVTPDGRLSGEYILPFQAS